MQPSAATHAPERMAGSPENLVVRFGRAVCKAALEVRHDCRKDKAHRQNNQEQVEGSQVPVSVERGSRFLQQFSRARQLIDVFLVDVARLR